MALKTVKVPQQFEEIFAKAEETVSGYFATRRDDPSKGTIEIVGERYILVRAASLSVEFFALVTRLFGEDRQGEADEFARNILFDLAHFIGKSDARHIQSMAKLETPIDRLAAGPVHFSHTGWAFVDILPESNPSPDEDYCLVYDHPYSFEADAWIRSGKQADCPVCVMNSGYSSGWCEESFGLDLVASEILCRAKGDDYCRFIMAPPEKIAKQIARYAAETPALAPQMKPYTVPEFLVRRQAQEKLRISEKRFHDLANSLPQSVFEIDIEGNLTFLNRGGMEMLGYTAEEFEAGLSAFQMFPPDQHQRAAENMQLILGGEQKPQGNEYTITRKNGETFQAVVYSSAIIHSDRPVGIRGIMVDMTEQNKAKEALVQAKQNWERTFDAVPDMVTIIDNNFNIIRANTAAAKRFGISKDQCVGRKCFNCFHEKNDVHSLCPHRKLMKDGREHTSEYYEPRFDAHMLVTVSPIHDDNGELVGSVHIARDITERKKAEEARRIKNRVIESSVNPIAMADMHGLLTYANNSFLQTWGYDKIKDVLGKSLEDFWHMRIETQDALRTGSNWIGKVSGRGKDASELDLQLSATLVRDENSEPLCMAFSFVNITEISQLRRRLKEEQSFAGIIGRDPKMLELYDIIREIAEVAVPVLIQGDSGTGKELVAAAIHSEGPRAAEAFVPVNCGALPEGILESELFGHVKGAFTGAVRDRKGRFELADGGTIFLDEVGDLPKAMQVKLLRVLQEGTFERVGGEETIKVDVRVISATNKNLRKEVNAGKFREDLFYRLSVVPVLLPPLRERQNDIPLLVDHLLAKAIAETGRANVSISPDAREAMMDYAWPGNIRELQNAIQYALVKRRGDILQESHLPPTIAETSLKAAGTPKKLRKRKLSPESVKKALAKSGGNKLQAARSLGVSRATLYRFLSDSE